MQVSRRPWCSYMGCVQRFQPLIHELLHPLTFISLGGINVALRISDDAMGTEEQTRLASAITELCQHFQRVTIQNMHFVVGTIGDVDKLLICIPGKSDIPGRARQRRRRHQAFFHEGSIGAEYLNAIGTTVTDIDQIISRGFGAMHRANELLWQGFAGDIADTVIRWLIAVSSPVAFEGPGCQVDNRNPLVAIAIGEIGLTGVGIYCYFRHPAKVRAAITIHIFTGIADFANELAIAVKHQHMRVTTAVATNPDVSIWRYFDAMVRCRPGVAIAGATPGIN